MPAEAITYISRELIEGNRTRLAISTARMAATVAYDEALVAENQGFANGDAVGELLRPGDLAVFYAGSFQRNRKAQLGVVLKVSPQTVLLAGSVGGQHRVPLEYAVKITQDIVEVPTMEEAYTKHGHQLNVYRRNHG